MVQHIGGFPNTQPVIRLNINLEHHKLVDDFLQPFVHNPCVDDEYYNNLEFSNGTNTWDYHYFLNNLYIHQLGDGSAESPKYVWDYFCQPFTSVLYDEPNAKVTFTTYYTD